MKYFTAGWWSEGCPEAEQLFAAYDSYLASVQDRVPAAIFEFNAAHTLHDSRLQTVAYKAESQEVQFIFLGWDVTFSQRVKYTLLLSDVQSLEQSFHVGRGSEQELGDLGYWEWEVVPLGVEMRLLFASSAEFRVVCKGFRFTYEKASA